MTKAKLWQLRKQVKLCSIYVDDFQNDMGIDTQDACNFFDGYAEYLGELMQNDGHQDGEFFNLLEQYDNPDNLYNWYLCFDGNPLPNPHDELYQLIYDMGVDDIVSIWNEYCQNYGNGDDILCSMDELDDILCNQKPSQIANLIWYGDFNPNYGYFKIDGYGNLKSIHSSDILDNIYIDDIVDAILENMDNLWNDEIQDFLGELMGV